MQDIRCAGRGGAEAGYRRITYGRNPQFGEKPPDGAEPPGEAGDSTARILWGVPNGESRESRWCVGASNRDGETFEVGT